MVTVRPNGFIQPSIPTRAAKPPSGFDAVRLFTRRGHDWTDRYAAIAKAAAKLRARSFIDGEAAVCGPNGVAIFDALHRRARKAKRARLLARNPAGIAFNEHANDDGAAVFRHACKMGLEGIVSKRLASPYRSDRSEDWIEAKNPDSSAMVRHREGRW